MGRYANQVLRRDFPDLSEDGDLIFVAIRNPKTVSMDRLMPPALHGEDAEDIEKRKHAVWTMLAQLVVDWHVYDANIDDDDSPALALPATPEAIASLPVEIVTWMTEQTQKVLATPQ